MQPVDAVDRSPEMECPPARQVDRERLLCRLLRVAELVLDRDELGVGDVSVERAQHVAEDALLLDRPEDLVRRAAAAFELLEHRLR